MIIDELFVALGFEFDDESKGEVDDFNEGIETATGLVKKLAVGAVATAGAIAFFVKQMSNANDELGKSAQFIGTSVEELDALSHAMEIATGSSDSLSSSMRAYSRNLSEAMRGTGPAIEVLGMMGLDARALSEDVVGSVGVIADRMKDFSRQEQIEFAEKLGIGDMILLLDQGSKGINELMREANELGVVTEGMAKSSVRLNDSWTRGVRVLKIYASEISAFIGDTMADYIDLFVEGSKVGLDWIRNVINLTQALGGLKNVLNKVFIVLSAIVALGIFATIGGFIKQLMLLTKVLNIVTVKAIAMKLALFAEWILIGALVAGVILIFEDLWTSLKGGQGLFAKLYKEFVDNWFGKGAFEEFTDQWADWIIEFEGRIDKVEKFFDKLDMRLKKSNFKEFFKEFKAPPLLFGASDIAQGALSFNSNSIPNVNTVNNKSVASTVNSPNNTFSITVNGNATPENIGMMRRELESMLINAQKDSEVGIVG